MADRLRPELKTWRMAEAGRAAVQHALTAAHEEGLESKVGYSLRQAGLFLTGACVTLEVGEVEDLRLDPPTPTALVPLTITDLDQLVALATGLRDRVVGMGLGDGELATQLADLRERLLAADIELREQHGIPTD